MATKKTASATGEELKVASVLAFERKLDPSDALFHAGNWDDRNEHAGWSAVTIREKSIRGTISNRLGGGKGDAAKLDAQIDKPNLQVIDVAALPSTADTLKISFTVRVLGGAGHPTACNSAPYRARLLETVDRYAGETGFVEIGARYAYTLACGRCGWRNRMGAEMAETRIERLVDGKPAKVWTLQDVGSWPLSRFDPPESARSAVDEIGRLIAAGLTGKEHVLLRVLMFFRLGPGQEVFPSQELILDRNNRVKSRTLYDVGGIAGMHSQKIGNAIRTIDDWHDNAAEIGPIPVEPYGSVTALGRAFRPPTTKKDFYNLLDGWVLRGQPLSNDEQHFVMANLVRGGVFGKADDKPAAGAATTAEA